MAQCHNSKSDETSAPRGKRTADEDSTLADAVEKHDGNNWDAFDALVPGREEKQWWHRWNQVLYSKDEMNVRVGKWTK
jgi:hypothetical protein